MDFESLLPSLWVNIHLKLSIFYRGPSKDAALEKFKRAMSSPITPSSFGLSHSINDEMWTPSAVLALDESTDIQDFRLARRNVQDPVQVFNACIDSLSDAVQKPRITYLECLLKIPASQNPYTSASAKPPLRVHYEATLPSRRSLRYSHHQT